MNHFFFKRNLNKKSEYKILSPLSLIIFSFIARTVSVIIYGDTIIYNEWAILLNNLIDFKAYSFYTFENQLIPSAYMPPLYAFLLYFLKIISFDLINLIFLIFLIQIILSTISVYIFYQINKNFFSNKISVGIAFVFSFFPLHLYSVGQTSSITLQIFLSLLFIKYFFLIYKDESKKNIIIFSIISGLLLLTRGEFLLILIFSLIYIFIFKKNFFPQILKILLITAIVISPYLIRNYIHFNEIFLIKSKGYNLWKGNNSKAGVEGYFYKFEEFKNLQSQLDMLKKDKYYEINRDDLFFKEALSNISNNPDIYLKLFLKKIISFYFIDLNSTYPNYYHYLNIIPILLISFLSFPGILFFLKKKEFFISNYLIIYLFSNLIIFSIFFILPRSKLVILPIQIILASYIVIYLYEKLLKTKNNK